MISQSYLRVHSTAGLSSPGCLRLQLHEIRTGLAPKNSSYPCSIFPKDVCLNRRFTVYSRGTVPGGGTYVVS